MININHMGHQNISNLDEKFCQLLIEGKVYINYFNNLRVFYELEKYSHYLLAGSLKYLDSESVENTKKVFKYIIIYLSITIVL